MSGLSLKKPKHNKMKLFNWIRGLFGRKVAGNTPQVSSVAVSDAPKKKAVVKKPQDLSAIYSLLNRLPRFRYPARRSRSRVSVTSIVRVCSGGRHAWFESNVGLVRKPIN